MRNYFPHKIVRSKPCIFKILLFFFSNSFDLLELHGITKKLALPILYSLDLIQNIGNTELRTRVKKGILQ